MRPEPTILAFDTSAAHCAAALLCGDRIISRVDVMSKGQAEHLMPMLADLLSGEDLRWQDLDGMGVGVGPGNFTGIRIAVSAARGLGLGLGKPAIGVNGFEARALGQTLPVMTEIPAARGQAYFQVFSEDGRIGTPYQDEATGGAQPSPSFMVENIARIAASRLGTPQPRPTPLYVRSADAAPPRDAAPLLLP